MKALLVQKTRWDQDDYSDFSNNMLIVEELNNEGINLLY